LIVVVLASGNVSTVRDVTATLNRRALEALSPTAGAKAPERVELPVLQGAQSEPAAPAQAVQAPAMPAPVGAPSTPSPCNPAPAAPANFSPAVR
jgi:hypothetical protein